jgi:hypothetical protein
MQPGSWFSRDRSISALTAWICALINQLVTPGLGTLVAGRLWAGLVELAIAFTGFSLVMAWFFNLFKAVFAQEDLGASIESHARLGLVGLLIFGIAWCLSLISSVRIVVKATSRDTRRPPTLKR